MKDPIGFLVAIPTEDGEGVDLTVVHPERLIAVLDKEHFPPEWAALAQRYITQGIDVIGLVVEGEG